jgi:hypothetical protein
MSDLSQPPLWPVSLPGYAGPTGGLPGLKPPASSEWTQPRRLKAGPGTKDLRITLLTA